MKRKSWISLIAGALLAIPPGTALSGQSADPPLRFIDAHTHLLPNMSAADEMAMLKKAGVSAVMIMSLPQDQQSLVKRFPGFVIPFVSFARTANSSLPLLNDATLAQFASMLDAGTACGFGEVGTAMQPPEPAAVTLMNPMRMKLYELANSRRAPLVSHVDLKDAEAIAAFGRVAQLHRDMPLILSHAGFDAGPEVSEALLAAHPNIFVELSIRLDPPNGFGTPSVAGPEGSNSTRSMLDANNALKPEWRRLMERFPDRFIFALDISPNGPKGRDLRAVELANIARMAFSVLPRASQEAIAHGNIEKLLSNCPAGPK